jgi:hypothetical protein
MTRFIGQILRILGLLIEMLGILVVALWARGDAGGGDPPGSFSLRLAWTAVAVGFVIWLIGTTLIYWPRPAPAVRKPKSDREGGPEV